MLRFRPIEARSRYDAGDYETKVEDGLRLPSFMTDFIAGILATLWAEA